ncbi:MAG: transporter [Paracoccaceae bacterium]
MLPLYLNYEDSFSSTVSVPLGGEISVGLDAKVDSLTFGGFYTFDQTVFGARYSVGAYLPYVKMDVTGTVGDFSRTDSVEGLGDITIIPAILAWESGQWQFDALLPIYAPTGGYQVGRLANPGLNYWTITGQSTRRSQPRSAMRKPASTLGSVPVSPSTPRTRQPTTTVVQCCMPKSVPSNCSR